MNADMVIFGGSQVKYERSAPQVFAQARRRTSQLGLSMLTSH
jgi:hypothetical protein